MDGVHETRINLCVFYENKMLLRVFRGNFHFVKCISSLSFLNAIVNMLNFKTAYIFLGQLVSVERSLYHCRNRT